MNVVPNLAWSRAVQDILQAGRRMDQRGWVPATAGNLSCRLEDGRIAITRSGGHKGFLAAADVIEIDPHGTPLSSDQKASAETLLHTQLYAHDRSIGAVLHGHSVPATVLSSTLTTSALTLTDYELLKVFEGQSSHQAVIDIPLFENDQDIARLAAQIAPFLGAMCAGYIIRGHGVYVWGRDMNMALARLEGLEFLLACELEKAEIMSRLTIYRDDTPDHMLFDSDEPRLIAETLRPFGIRFERWQAPVAPAKDARPEDVLAAYRPYLDGLMGETGAGSADVVRFDSKTPQLAAMREKYLSEHTHSEDEVRFFVHGQGAFVMHIDGKVLSVLCTQGDLISVPAGTPHWFDAGLSPDVVALRVFTDTTGWVANYTGDAIAARFPVTIPDLAA